MKHIGTVFALPPSQNCTGDWHVFLRFGTWKQQDMICWFILLGRASISCLYTKIAGKISVTSSTDSICIPWQKQKANFASTPLSTWQLLVHLFVEQWWNLWYKWWAEGKGAVCQNFLFALISIRGSFCLCSCHICHISSSISGNC